jgi:hypothetical protein
MKIATFLAPKIKLPPIEIPQFGGQITEFKLFHDSLNSLITNPLNLLDTKCFNELNILTTVRSAHTVFMCFVFI